MGEFFVGLMALTLFGSVIWFWLVLAIFLVFCVLSEVKHNGYIAFGFFVVFLTATYFWGSETFEYFKSVFVWKNVLLYLGFGVLYSVFKTIFMTGKLKKVLKTLPETSTDSWVQTKEKEKRGFIEKLEGNVARWIFMWPISLIVWLFQDLFVDIWNAVWRVVRGFYLYIVDWGLKYL
jgi:hypothetical protein